MRVRLSTAGKLWGAVDAAVLCMVVSFAFGMLPLVVVRNTAEGLARVQGEKVLTVRVFRVDAVH